MQYTLTSTKTINLLFKFYLFLVYIKFMGHQHIETYQDLYADTLFLSQRGEGELCHTEFAGG